MRPERLQYFYFSIDNAYLHDETGITVFLKVTCFDDAGFIEPQYDAVDNRYAPAERVTLGGNKNVENTHLDPEEREVLGPPKRGRRFPPSRGVQPRPHPDRGTLPCSFREVVIPGWHGGSRGRED